MTTTHTIRPVLRALAAAAALAVTGLATPLAQAANTLEGWALMPAATVADGPTTGQFTGNGFGANSSLLPIINGQSVQGFSAVLNGPSAGSYYFMPDNGFGSQGNSADALLRVYAVTPDFKTASGGSGTVSAANYGSGAALGNFSAASQITLADPDRKLGFAIQADYARYYNGSATLNPLGIAVDASIKAGRLLTGADFDVESVRKDKNGNLWFGEEFGPFLLKTDASGKVLAKEIAMPGVMAPQNPYLGSGTATLGTSRGFEGMAINQAGDRLYTLLEGTVTGDPAKTLRISEFNTDTASYTGASWSYLLDSAGTNIGDMTAINDHEFLVIERNGATATGGGTPFKKIFRVDIHATDGAGHVKKTEVVDLMAIADPHDLNGDGSTSFTFPYVTIESVLVLDSTHLLVANDNNFPGGGGRSAAPDATEFLVIGLDQPLTAAVPEPGSWALLMAGLGLVSALARRRRR
jgi:hypothetical protein